MEPENFLKWNYLNLSTNNIFTKKRASTLNPQNTHLVIFASLLKKTSLFHKNARKTKSNGGDSVDFKICFTYWMNLTFHNIKNLKWKGSPRFWNSWNFCKNSRQFVRSVRSLTRCFLIFFFRWPGRQNKNTHNLIWSFFQNLCLKLFIGL